MTDLINQCDLLRSMRCDIFRSITVTYIDQSLRQININQCDRFRSITVVDLDQSF